MEHNTVTEEKIVEAATSVFLEKGKDGARMQAIADKAGINKALLHYYFRSKNKLFKIVFTHQIKKILGNILSNVEGSDEFHDFIESFVHTYMQSIAPRKHLLRFVIWEIGRDDPDLFTYFQEVFKDFGYAENPIIDRTRKAIAEGQIRNVDPVQFTISLMGMCLFPFLTYNFLDKILPGFDPEDPNFITQRTKEITSLVWDGIKPGDLS